MWRNIILAVVAFGSVLAVALWASTLQVGEPDSEMSTHGKIALWVTVIGGLVFGLSAGALFFALARRQSAEERRDAAEDHDSSG